MLISGSVMKVAFELRLTISHGKKSSTVGNNNFFSWLFYCDNTSQC